MTIAYDELASRLSFGLPDRLGKALDASGVSSAEMAEYLGVSRNTVSNYINGRTEPKKQTLRLWAMRCGVPLGWIETGMLGAEGGNGPEGGGTSENPENAENNVLIIRNEAPNNVRHLDFSRISEAA